jgi:hypothetical protein
MTVEGDLDIGYDNNPFADTWASGEVYLEGAKVGGNAVFGGGHFVHSKVEPLGWSADLKRAVDLNKSEIKGELALCCGFEWHGAAILDGAKIGSATRQRSISNATTSTSRSIRLPDSRCGRQLAT